jgi:hypothetical protein
MNIKDLKALIANVADDTDVYVALGSFRVDLIVSSRNNEVCFPDPIDGTMKSKKSLVLYPENYKVVETKGIDY